MFNSTSNAMKFSIPFLSFFLSFLLLLLFIVFSYIFFFETRQCNARSYYLHTNTDICCFRLHKIQIVKYLEFPVGDFGKPYRIQIIISKFAIFHCQYTVCNTFMYVNLILSTQAHINSCYFNLDEFVWLFILLLLLFCSRFVYLFLFISLI